MGDNNYNLKGLKLVFIGMIIQMIASVFSGSSVKNGIHDINVSSTQASGVDGLTVAMGLMSFVGLILIIVGLSKVKSYSANFLKSRNYYIINIFLGVAMIIFAAVMAGVAVSSLSTYNISGNTSTGSGTIILMLVVISVMAVIMVVIGLLAVRGLLLGCGDVARANGDEYLAGKCIKAWRLYLIATLVIIGAVIAVIIAAFVSVMASVGSGNFGHNMQMSMAGGLVVAVVVIIAAAIFMLVAQIIILIRIWNTYSRFNGRPLSGSAETVNIPGFAQGEWVHVNDPGQPENGPVVNGTALPTRDEEDTNK